MKLRQTRIRSKISRMSRTYVARVTILSWPSTGRRLRIFNPPKEIPSLEAHLANMSRRSTPTKFTEVAEEVPQPIEIIEEKEAVTEDKPSLEPADMATVVQEMDPKHEPELIPDEGVAKIMPNDMMTVQVEQDSGFDTMDTIPIDPRPDGGRAWKAGLFDGLKDCNKCKQGFLFLNNLENNDSFRFDGNVLHTLPGWDECQEDQLERLPLWHPGLPHPMLGRLPRQEEDAGGGQHQGIRRQGLHGRLLLLLLRCLPAWTGGLQSRPVKSRH